MPLRSPQSTSGSPPANDVGKPAAESTLLWVIGVLMIADLAAAESTLRRVLWVIGVLMIADLAIAALLAR
jgi:hypothetical protein